MNQLFTPRHSLPMIFQAEANECGLACLAMIVSYYSRATDIRSIREASNLPAFGASLKHLTRAAAAAGLKSRPLKLELADLPRLATPAILHWDLDHFVVLKKFSRGKAVIHDPATGVRKYPLRELDGHFTGVAVEFSQAREAVAAEPPRRLKLGDLVSFSHGIARGMALILLLSLLVQACALLSPLYLQLVIDQGLARGDMDLVLVVALLFGLLMLARIALGHVRSLVTMQFSMRLGFEMVSGLFEHLLNLPLRFFERREMGDLVSRFSSAEKISALISQDMITVLVDGLLSLASLALLYVYSPMLATVCLGFVVAAALIKLCSLPGEKLRRQETIVRAAKSESRLMENVRWASVVKNYAIEEQRAADWQNHYVNSANAGYQLGTFQLWFGSGQGLLFGVEQILVIFLGAQLISAGGLTIGQLMGFIFLKQHFSSSVLAMLPKLAELRLMQLDLERIADIALEAVEETDPLGQFPRRAFSGKVSGEGLSFRYSADETPIFEALDFALEPGETLVITGPSGCGKSTLLKLIAGLEPPTAGRIRYDGGPLRKLGLANLRSAAAAVLHSDGLLAGDIAYNINLEDEPHNQPRLEDACRRACILEEILALPLGFNTRVGELGNSLSAGQVQRVLLARALYKRPKLLLLDESLACLSDAVAGRILENIAELGIAIVLVTHNPALARLGSKRIELAGPQADRQ
ncbi:MAG: peptidase domain-containing ABC transporter [Gammaproteobacteria bacterium]|nr:peptidase domain-containing ABC transporter [Gammaproteobacteria bacterium]